MAKAPRRPLFTVLAVLTSAVLAGGLSLAASPDAGAAVAFTLPPVNAKFDYQIGGPYTPPSGVQVVSRDRTAAPAAGLYNICYINAFQVQPDEVTWWQQNHDDLLLQGLQWQLRRRRRLGRDPARHVHVGETHRARRHHGRLDRRLRRGGLQGDRTRQHRFVRPFQGPAHHRQRDRVPAVAGASAHTGRAGDRSEEHDRPLHRRPERRAGLRDGGGVRPVRRVRQLHRGLRSDLIDIEYTASAFTKACGRSGQPSRWSAATSRSPRRAAAHTSTTPADAALAQTGETVTVPIKVSGGPRQCRHVRSLPERASLSVLKMRP